MDEKAKIITGVFDGENMVAKDGRRYPVPANYASKSKLVEGDELKLTVADDGSFVFKQIRPIERKRLIASVEKESPNSFKAKTEDATYRLLFASATYFQLEAGEQVVILVPKNQSARWAAVENKVSL